MFDGMGQQIDVRSWKEKLDDLKIGTTEPVDIEQSVYSAIRNHFSSPECKKEFSVRTDKKSKLDPKPKYVIRLK